MIFTKENLIDMLRNNIVTVTFTKVNGEERVMKCTLMSEYVPNAPTNNGQILLQESEAKTVSVWDTEANGWRSFRVESVKSISMG
jgi:WYL_2, Sm-like SH3 beta-barrel fold